MRLFIGLPIPLDVAQSMIQMAHSLHLPPVRWSEPENIHLTLVFLGEVAEAKLPLIVEQIQLLDPPYLPIRLIRFGSFPRAGVLLAMVEPDLKLMQLQAQVSARMAACGFPPEDRPYQPHLTLARSRQPIRLQAAQTKLPSHLRHGFEATAVQLYRSYPTATGSCYEVLATRSAEIPGTGNV